MWDLSDGGYKRFCKEVEAGVSLVCGRGESLNFLEKVVRTYLELLSEAF